MTVQTAVLIETLTALGAEVNKKKQLIFIVLYFKICRFNGVVVIFSQHKIMPQLPLLKLVFQSMLGKVKPTKNTFGVLNKYERKKIDFSIDLSLSLSVFIDNLLR